MKNLKQFPGTDRQLFSNWQGQPKRLTSMHISSIFLNIWHKAKILETYVQRKKKKNRVKYRGSNISTHQISKQKHYRLEDNAAFKISSKKYFPSVILYRTSIRDEGGKKSTCTQIKRAHFLSEASKDNALVNCFAA